LRDPDGKIKGYSWERWCMSTFTHTEKLKQQALSQSDTQRCNPVNGPDHTNPVRCEVIHCSQPGGVVGGAILSHGDINTNQHDVNRTQGWFPCCHLQDYSSHGAIGH
ncbi:hypothetical protein GOODEAATRI_023989, partial [Goodea atripinnis]